MTASAPLGELVTVVGGGTPDRGEPAYWGPGYPWATVKDMKGFELSETEESITPAGLQHSASRVVPAGSIVLATRMALGKVAVATVPMAINQDLKALTCSPAIDPRFLLHYLAYRAPQIDAMGMGATVKGVTLDRLTQLRVPTPSLHEQRRIAAMLDRADAIRRKRRESIKLLDEFLRSAFLEMFGDPVGDGRAWHRVLLDDVAEIVSGVTKGRKLSSASQQVSYLRVANVQDGYLDLAEMKTIEATAQEITQYALRLGDIVLTEGGDPDKLGRGAVWHGEVEPCIHQNHVFRVRLRDEEFTPEFVSALLGSAYGKRYFLKAAKQTTGIASINRTQLGGFPVLRAPSALQKRYSAIVLATADTAANLGHAEAEANRLFDSLAQQAFSR